MLFKQTVDTRALAILNRLMSINELKDFSLVGGTALSLKFGHRISEDLDLFGTHGFDKGNIISALMREFKDKFYYEERGNTIGVFCYIDKVKIDIVNYSFNLIRPIEVEEGIRFYSNEDIAAMKIAAILRRAKKKDFWDIAELLQYFKVDDFVDFFYQKYPSQLLAISIPQVMTYFLDAEKDDNPVSLKNQTWDSVKKIISKSVNQYLK